MKRRWKTVLSLMITTAIFVEMDPVLISKGISVQSSAQARVGRPATPGSVAGVARRSSRRTTRRVIRRGAYVAALPAGCRQTSVDGYAVYSCGGAYYQASGGGYVVVTFE